MYFPDEAKAENVNESVDSDEVVSGGDDLEEDRPRHSSVDDECTEPPPKERRANITPSKEPDMFDYLDKETMCLLNGGKDLEYKKLEETKRHNLVLEQVLKLQDQKEKHQYKMMLFKDFKDTKSRGIDDQDIVDSPPDMEVFTVC